MPTRFEFLLNANKKPKIPVAFAQTYHDDCFDVINKILYYV